MVVPKPWGHELIWAKTDQYVGKILHIKAGHQLSLQFHNEKEETIYVQQGQLQFHYDGKDYLLCPGQSFHILPKMVHRMTALAEDCTIFEVSTPQLQDVVRLQDSYGRVDKS